MKVHSKSTPLFVAALLAMAGTVLVGCQTDADGVKSNYYEQWTNINAPVADVTAAAEDILNDLDLKDVASTSTKLNGKATGKDVDGKKIRVDIERLTDKTSQVSVNVGKAGNHDQGKLIAAKLRENFMDE